MAADTFSDILGWVNQGTGNNNNAWGDVCDNSIFPIFEKGIAGLVAHAVTGGTLDLSDDAPPSGPTQALEHIQAFSGTLAANQIVVVPNLPKTWLVYNATSGAYTLTFKTPDGVASPAIPQGGWAFVFCDGGDGVYVGLSTTLRDVQWLGADGTLAAPGLSFAAEATMGLRRVSSGTLALTIGGVDVATFSAAGLNVASGLTVSVGGAPIVPPGVEVEFAGIRAPAGWYLEYGQSVARSGDAALMDAITETFTATTNGTTTLSAVSKDLRGLGLEGSVLEGTGMATGATIVSIDSATQITMSAAATTSTAGTAIRAFPFGNGDGVSTFTLPDARGTVAAGRDNMGGTAAGRLTTAGSGVDGLLLKTIGGAQSVTMALENLIQHDHTVFLHDPGHSHATNAAIPAGVGAYNPGAVSPSGGGATIYAATTGITIWSNGAGAGTQNKVGKTGSATPTPMRTVQPTRIRNVIIKR